MRKIMAGAFVSLDGVMQAPGGPDEDPTGGFTLGGWTPAYWDEVLGESMDALFAAPFDVWTGTKLFGRRGVDVRKRRHRPAHRRAEPGAPAPRRAGPRPGRLVGVAALNSVEPFVQQLAGIDLF